jgi:hypothetical protein
MDNKRVEHWTVLQIAVYAVNCSNDDSYIDEVVKLIDSYASQQCASLREQIEELKKKVEKLTHQRDESFHKGYNEGTAAFQSDNDRLKPPMENKEHSFVLKEDGKIYWIENLPKEPITIACSYKGDCSPCVCAADAFSNKANRDVVDYYDDNCPIRYKQALQSAIDNAVEVSNQDEFHRNSFSINGWQPLEVGKVYSLQCRVEKKGVCGYTGTPCGSECYFCESDTIPVALVTFDSPLVEEQRETQEQLWKEVFHQTGSRMDFMQFLQKHFTITRKPQPPKQ